MPSYLLAETGHAAELAERTIVVGSEAGVDIPIRADLGVAPRHYEITPWGGTFQVRSLDLQWPLWVNEAQVQVAVLKDGDVITAGALRLAYRYVEPSPAAVAMPAPPPMQSIDSSTNHAAYSDQETPSEEDAPTIGARLPGRMALPDDADEMEGFSESTKQRRRAEKLMSQSLQRTQKRMNELKEEQNYNRAFQVAIVAVILGCVAFLYASGLGWKFYVPVLGGIGYGIGWLVRISGKGIDRQFGQLACAAGVASVLLANVVSWQGEMESYKTAQAETAEPEEEEYASEAPEEKAERLRREENTRRQDEERERLMEAEHQAMMERLMKENPGVFADAGRRDYSDDDEEVDEAFDEEDESEEDEYSDSMDAGIKAFALGWLFFGPRSLVAYFLIGGAAWRSAFRHLSNEEASDLHLGTSVRTNQSHLSVQERVRQGMNQSH